MEVQLKKAQQLAYLLFPNLILDSVSHFPSHPPVLSAEASSVSGVVPSLVATPSHGIPTAIALV